MSSSSIALRKVRGVADVLNVSFRFARRYWRILLKSLLYLLVPPVVLGYLFFAAVGLEGLMTYMLDPQAVLQGELQQPGLLILGGLVSGLMSFTGSALGMTAVLSVVRLHERHGPEGVTFDAMLAHTKRRFLHVLGTQFGVMAVLIPGAVLVIIPCLGALVYLGGVVFVMVRYLFLTIPIQVLADESFAGSFRRTGALARGHFWETAGVALLTFVAVFILSSGFALPLQALRFVGDFHTTGGYPTWLQVVFAVLLVLSNAGSMVSVTLQSMAGAVQYYNLEEQERERGVEKQVEQLERTVEQGGEGQRERGEDTNDEGRDVERVNPSGNEAPPDDA